MIYRTYFADAGVAKTGLTPTWASLVKVSDGSDYTPQPAWAEIAGGWYKSADVTFTEAVVGVIDGGAALATAADRYVSFDATPQDAFLDKSIVAAENVVTVATDAIMSKLGDPVGVSISADIAAIDAVVTEGVPHYYYPSIATRVLGSDQGGLVAVMAAHDEVLFGTGEITGGGGGMEVTLDFSATDIAQIPAQLNLSGFYNGSAGHQVNVYLWNYTLSAWEQRLTMISRTSAFDYTCGLSSDFHDVSGNMRVRFLHVVNSGALSAGHRLWLDIVQISKIEATNSLQSDVSAIRARTDQMQFTLGNVNASPTLADIEATAVLAKQAKLDTLHDTRIPGIIQPQTGDAFARLGEPDGASVSADLAAVKSDTGAAATQVSVNELPILTEIEGSTKLLVKTATSPTNEVDVTAENKVEAHASVVVDNEAIAAAVDLELTEFHGAGSWGGITGSRQITLTVYQTSTTIAIQDVQVSIRNGIGQTIGTVITDSNGQAVFGLNDGTYSLLLRKAGVTFGAATDLVVDDDEPIIIYGTLVDITIPIPVGAIRVFEYCFMPDGITPMPVVLAKAQVKNLPSDYNGRLHSGQEIDFVYDPITGIGYWDLAPDISVEFDMPTLFERPILKIIPSTASGNMIRLSDIP